MIVVWVSRLGRTALVEFESILSALPFLRQCFADSPKAATSIHRLGLVLGRRVFQSRRWLLEEHFTKVYGNITRKRHRKMIISTSPYVSGIQIPTLSCPMIRKTIVVKSCFSRSMQWSLLSNKFHGEENGTFHTVFVDKNFFDRSCSSCEISYGGWLQRCFALYISRL